MRQSLREMAGESLAIIEALGQEIPPEAQDMLFQMISIGLALIPTILVLISAIQVWLVMMISVPVIKRLGISVPAGQPFRELSFPRSLIWYFLSSRFCLLSSRYSRGISLSTVFSISFRFSKSSFPFKGFPSCFFSPMVKIYPIRYRSSLR